jgi:hypothetical protein
LSVRLLVLAACVAHDALEHVANSAGSGLLLGLLIHGFARGRGVGSGSGFLSTLSGGVPFLDVDDLIFAQRSRVARATSSPLELLLRFATGARMSVDVLGLSSDVGMYIGLHVALASSSGGVGLGLDRGRLEVLGLEVRRGRCHVACLESLQ